MIQNKIARLTGRASAAVGLKLGLVVFALSAGLAGAAPANDQLANAVALSGLSGSLSGTNNNATFVDVGEPVSVAAANVTNSVWFQWTAPESGKMLLDTFGSDFDTVLAVYADSVDVGNLVAANDNLIPWFVPQSWVTFTAVAGTTYYISVNGNAAPTPGYGDSGNFVLNWAETVPTIPSGTFSFTSDYYEVSDYESDPGRPYDIPMSKVPSMMGARVTVTRTAGSSGRVIVPYTVTDQVFETYDGELIFDDYQMSADIVLPVSYIMPLDGTAGTNSFQYAPPESIGVSLGTPVLDLQEQESSDLIPPGVGLTDTTVQVLSGDYQESDAFRSPPFFNFERETFRAREKQSNAVIYVYPSQAPGVGNTMSVQYAIDHRVTLAIMWEQKNNFALQAGSDYAIPDVDFTDVSGGTLTWSGIDRTPKPIYIPITDDTNPEFNEDLEIKLYNPHYSPMEPALAALGQVNTATLTILSDDQPAGAVDRSWNKDGFKDSVPPFLQYPGTQGGVSDSGNGNGGTVYAAAVQPNGKTILAGSFITFDSHAYNRIVRLQSDGYQDPAFQGNFTPWFNSGANDFIAALALQPDGRILIGGNFTAFNGVNRYRIARLNSDGSLDNTFNPGLGVNGMVWSLALQTNGQVVIGGQFSSVNGTDCKSVARLNADGSLDASFNPGVGPTKMVDGVLTGGTVKAVVVDGRGRVCIGGDFTQVAGLTRGGVARLDTNGTVDVTFDPGIGTYNPDTGNTDPVNALALQADGRLLAGGSFAYVELSRINGLVRFNADGTVDTAFSTLGLNNGTFNPVTGVADSVNAITLQPDGTILIGGDFISLNQTRRIGLARLFSNGSLDTSFLDTAYNQFAGVINHYHNPDAINLADYPQGNHRNSINAIALEAGGDVIIGGNFLRVGGGAYRHANPSDIQNSDGIYGVDRAAEHGIYYNARMDIHPRSNVARLIGGVTPGPGNIEFAYDHYSVDKSGGSLFVTLVRTNGNLGDISATFDSPPGDAGQQGIASTPADFSMSNLFPTWSSTWQNLLVVQQPGWIYSDAFEGPNFNYPARGNGADETLTIINNTNLSGNLNANLALSAPYGDGFNLLGGEFIPLGAALGGIQASPLTIIDDNFPAGTFGFSSPAYTVNENASTATITVTRTNGTDGQVQVTYVAFPGTASFPADFTAVSGTLTFNQGDISKTFTVPIVPTTVNRPDKTVNLRLFGITGGGLPGVTNAVLTIVNNVFGSGHIAFAFATNTVSETAGTAGIQLNRLGASSGTLDVTMITSDGTAVNGVNYIGSTNVVHWDNGSVLPKLVAIPVLHDGIGTSNLTVKIRLANGLAGGFANTNVLGLSAITNSTLVITNVDFPGTVQFTSGAYSVKEYGGFALLPVIRTGGSAGTLTVDFNTLNGTAVSPANYAATNGTLTFTNGEVSKYIRVTIIDDGVANVPANVPLQLNVKLTSAMPATALGSVTNAVLNLIDTATVGETPGDTDVTYSSLAGFNGPIFALVIQTNNNQLLAGGDFTMADGVPRQRLARLNANGTLDASFGLPSSSMGASGSVRALILQTDGRILAGGFFTNFNGVARSRVARLNYDGSLDSLFDPGSGADNPVFALGETFVNGQRKVLLGGSFARLDGATFNGIGRLNDDGTPDSAFNPGGLGADATVYAMAVQSDGKIIIGGDFNHVNGIPANHIARLNVNGSVDMSFTNATANDSVRAISLQRDGQILIGGLFTSVNGNTNFNHLARLNRADGSPDSTFNPGLGADDAVFAIALQTDGRMVLGGEFTRFSGVTRNRVTRLNPDGTVDPTINFGAGADAFVGAVAIEESRITGYPADVPNEKIIIGGGFTHYHGEAHDRLARIYGGSISGSGAFEFSQANYQVNENGTNAVITINRTGGTSGTNPTGLGNIFVAFYATNGTAKADIDHASVTNYFSVVTNLAFAPGEVLQTVIIPVQDDQVITNDLTVNLSLTPMSPGEYGYQPTAVLTILNTDSAIKFSTATYQVPKNVVNGLAMIEVVRAGSSHGTSTVVFNTTTNGSALAGTDYLPQTNVLLTFNPGVTQQVVTVPVVNNGLPEGNRTVSLLLSNAIGSVMYAPSNALLTIIDTVTAPGELLFSATNYTVSEGGGVGSTNALITVLRTNGAAGIVTVSYATANGTAVAGAKYVFTSGVLTFGDGETSKTFAVPVLNTATVEPTEFFSVLLTNAGGGAGIISPSNATVTIWNTNIGIAFGAATNTFLETTLFATVNVVRYNNIQGTSTIHYATTNGTATNGIHYAATSGMLTFNDGASQAAILIPLIYDTNANINPPGDRQFTVGLFDPSPGVLVGAPSLSTVVLQDVDTGLSFATNSSRVLKNGGSVLVTVVCSNTNVEPVSVSYATADGTGTNPAVAGVDYMATSGILTFSNGVSALTFAVPVLNNGAVNGDHVFTISLSNPTGTGRLVSPSTNTVTIIDSNSGISFSSANYSVVKTGSAAVITVYRTGYTDTVSTVNFFATNGTALNGLHFVATNGVLVFTNGVTSNAFIVPVIATTVIQPDLTVLLELSSPTNGVLFAPTAARLTITDNTGGYVIPAGSQLTAETGAGPVNGIIDSNETVTVRFAFRNAGGLDVPDLMAELLPTNGVASPSPASQSYGLLLAHGHSAFRSFTFVAHGTNHQQIVATFKLTDGTNTFPAVFGYTLGSWATTLANTNVIVINDNTNASPYPSLINVSGVGGTLIKATVTLTNLSHTAPSDIGALVVNPGGSNTLIMANAGGTFTVTNATLTFDDAAANPLQVPIVSGTNKPSGNLPVKSFP